jgi:hypothetical protein
MSRLLRGVAVAIMFAAAGFSGTSSTSAQTAAVPDSWLSPSFGQLESERCATGDDRLRQLGARPLALVPDGRPGSYVQDPPVISADFDGVLTLRDFAVLGDVPTARFMPAGVGAELETWRRTGTKTVAGRTVSLFNPSWSGTRIGAFLSSNPWGWDDGGIYWGEFLPGDTVPGAGWGITVRIAPRSLPAVTVVQLADDIQYSSHVVNIVVPDFGDGFLRDDHGFELSRVTQRFFQEFEDTYDTVSIVPQAGFTASYAAFHRNVRNDVTGIGLDPFDNAALYGSAARRLRAVELFLGANFTRAATSSHELAHQWGSYIDWTRLSGVSRAGSDPSGHDPLWSQGETLIGSVLRPWRRAEASGEAWQIGLTPPPARLHPFTLYAMGLLPKESVPPVHIFDDQAQFNPEYVTTPAVGTPIAGGAQSVTVFNVIGLHGERSGPVPSEWQRATIVVSRDGLLSAREMDYWTYFARRLEDPARTGVVGFEGVGSFEAATLGRVDVKTAIRPLRAAPILETAAVDGLAFDMSDVRGVTFDQPIPSRFQTGRTNVWSGVVRTTDRSDIDSITLRFWKYGGTTGNAIRINGRVDARSSFRLEKSFDASEKGLYQMEVFLFWQDSGVQYSRGTLTPILIE